MTASLARPSSAFEPLLTLAAGEVHLWLCRGPTLEDSDQLKRRLLSRYAAVAPEDWRFAVGEHGKPFLVDPPLPLAFNLSHSREWMACAIGIDAEMGVDLEYCDPGRAVMRLARRYFAAGEVADLEGMDREQRRERFYDYWTLKEAWIKARGSTLARELDAAEFAFTEAGSIELRRPRERLAADFWLLGVAPAYRLALCRQHEGRGKPDLRVFRSDSGCRSEELAVSLRAASGSVGWVT